MGAALKIQEENFDQVFGDISKIYDHAGNILDIAHDAMFPEADQFVDEIESLVAEIEESANILASDLSEVVETGIHPTADMNERVTQALKKVMNSIDEYKTSSKFQGN